MASKAKFAPLLDLERKASENLNLKIKSISTNLSPFKYIKNYHF